MQDNLINKRVSFLSLTALFVLVFSVTRGLVPLISGAANLARPTYNMSFSLGLFLSAIGLYYALFKRNQVIPKRLRLLLIVNFTLMVIWLIPIVAFNPEPSIIISFAYSGLFPFAILMFTKITEKHLKITMVIFTLLVAGTIIWDFVELNTDIIPDGYDAVISRQLLLRPDNFEAFGRTSELLRPVGILGHRPHDSGNLLAILSVYWIALLFRPGKAKANLALISSIGISGMLMTQSAANIVAFFVGVLFILYSYRRMILKNTGAFNFLIVLATGAATLYVFSNYFGIQTGMLWQWSQRVGSEGAWAGMMNMGITNITSDLFAILFGHGSSFSLSAIGDVSEVGLIKMLVEYGLLSWVVFIMILIYPIMRYFRAGSMNKQSALPYIAAILTGVISL